MIEPLALYVLEAALRQAYLEKQDGLELTVAVNVATRNLLDAEFPGRVATLF